MTISLRPFCPAANAEGEKSSTAKLSRAEIMVKRIGKGINVDVSQLEEGSPWKVLYDPAQYDAVKAAGFQSVRFFVVAVSLSSTTFVAIAPYRNFKTSFSA